MAERTLSIEDVKRRAEEVGELAKAEVRRATKTEPAQLIAIGVVGVLLVASFAYYLGARKCSCGDPYA